MLGFVHFGPTQRWLTQTAEDLLEQTLRTEVKIGALEVGLFNRVLLRDVCIYDQERKPLLQAERLTAKVALRSLVQEQLSLRTISILDTQINLYKPNATSPTNFQFIVDALSSKEKKETKGINLRVNSVILRRIQVKYDQLDRPRTPGKLNPSHLLVDQINANISLKSLTPDLLRLHVRSLAFREQSGFELRHLRLKLRADRQGATIEDFEMRLPQSVISQSDLRATYDARAGWDRVWNTLRVEGNVRDAWLTVADIRSLVKLPPTMELSARLSTRFAVSPQRLRFSQLRLADSQEEVNLEGGITVQRQGGKPIGLAFDVTQLTVDDAFFRRIMHWVKADSTLTGMVGRVGDVSLQGKGELKFAGPGKGHFDLSTQVGKLTAQLDWDGRSQLQTHLQLQDAQPARLLARTQLPQSVSLCGDVALQFDPVTKRWAGVSGATDVLRLVWNQQAYQHIRLQGAYTSREATAVLLSSDPKLPCRLQGRVAWVGNQLDKVELAGNIAQLNLQELGWQTPYQQARFSGTVEAHVQGLSTTSPQGKLQLRDFNMLQSPQGDYHLGQLTATLEPVSAGVGRLSLHSDFLDAQLQGDMTLSHLTNGVKDLLNRSLPGLLVNDGTPSAVTDSRWDIQASLKRTDVLEKMARIPLQTKGPVFIQGYLATGKQRSALSVRTDGFTIGRQPFGTSSLYFDGQGTRYHCLVKTQKEFAGKQFDVMAKLSTRDSLLDSRIAWNAHESTEDYSGSVSASTRFYANREAVNFRTQVHPTGFTLDGLPWKIGSGEISLLNREVTFRNISLNHEQQGIKVDGRFSPQKNDSIVAELKDIDVEYILDLVNFHAVDFGGRATGKAIFTKSNDAPDLHARLYIPDFTFNHGPMGRTTIDGTWSPRDNRIYLDADMKLPQGFDLGTKVNGFVSLAEKGLKLHIQANRTNLSFLKRYMNGIFENFSGEATGAVTLYGPFKALDFRGKLTADASARIPATGVAYHISNGTVDLSPGEFAFRQFTVSDGKGGSGRANGYLRHNHLKDLTYDFDVTAQHLLCYDQPESHDMPFYSTTTGSGKVHLEGVPGRFTADIALRPEAPTTLVYNLSTGESLAAEDNMIRFHAQPAATPVGKEEPQEEGTQRQETPEEDGQTSDIILNFLIDANPAAQVKVITDARSGDALTVYGEGPIRASFHNKGNFEMYGTYRLQRGSYKISIQDIIRKDLTLKAGSSMTFAGNPLLADLNLQAVYTVNGVALSDLNYGAGFSQKSARVDCILNIGGKAKSPQVKFDIDLQGISEDEKQMVRQLIATDEDMNRQAIYLLGIGRFYTANPQSSIGQSSSQQQSAAAMRSFLSTTLTSQLNSAISSMLGSESQWSFGTNVAPGTLGWSDIEVDALLQGRLFNDRLLINGNFGYRDRPTYTSNFIGDFDIRYLLTPKGSMSLRAYSETTDRYFTKSSLTTQGIGLTLQRDFTRLRDLFTWTGRREKLRKKRETKRQKKGERRSKAVNEKAAAAERRP